MSDDFKFFLGLFIICILADILFIILWYYVD